MVDNQKIGLFIAECRKEKSLTQKQLGEQLHVSDKAVSKWEKGRSFPDISLVESLCEILGISMGELLAGERLGQENYQEKTDEMMMNFVVGGNKIWLMQLMMRAVLFGGLLFWIIPFWKRESIYPIANASTFNLFTFTCRFFACLLIIIYFYLDIKLPMRTYRNSNAAVEVLSTILYFGVVCLPSLDNLLKYPEERPLMIGTYAVLLVVCILAAIFRARRSRKKIDIEEI
ncbi:MAG: helix-turn-helix transcriptional regulator [Lachnospiraceae bacterium]|nr:helix-turn-helix transcriptional regulator [Lachnospiraceae bacterium]